MKKILEFVMPKEKQDAFLYCLIMVAVLPFIYLLFDETISYLILNFIGLLIILIVFIFQYTKAIRQNRMFTLFKSPAFIILLMMFGWILLSTFFAYDKNASWLGLYEGRVREDSIWQYMFYFVVAICAINTKKQNIPYIISLFILVANILILVQFAEHNFGYGFIHKNHTGYYLCMTLMLSVGMFLFSKKVIPCCLFVLSMILHFASLVLNGSMGPIIGIIAFFVVGLVYILIHKRELFVKFLSVFACFIVVFSFIDFVPGVRDLRDESATTIEKVIDIGKVALNKVGLVKDENVTSDNISAGSDGYNRIWMWERACQNMIELPLFGTGVGSWKSYNPDMPSIKPHNEFLQYGATAGGVTLIAYLALIIYLFAKFRKNHKQGSNVSLIVLGAVLVYLVQSIFGNVMPFTAPLFFILIGFSIKEIDAKKLEIINANQKLVENFDNEKNIS